jgi:hypothetical protein
LAVPPVRAQTAEDFQKLKTLVEQMQKTIEAQNARIADLEKAKPPAAGDGDARVTAETSPRFARGKGGRGRTDWPSKPVTFRVP